MIDTRSQPRAVARAAPRREERDVERRVAALADRQDGLVARRQLLALGMGPGAIAHRLRTGRLVEAHRGVYGLGHLPRADRPRLRAALLAVGDDAVVSHRSAAAWWALAPDAPPVHVTAAGRRGRTRSGIVVHTCDRLEAASIRTHRGVPVTAPARTIVDFAVIAAEAEIERAVAEAQVLRLLTMPDLEAAVAARPRHRGAALVRRLIDAGAPPTRSELERRLRRLVRDAGLPMPEMNHRVAPFTLDACWIAESVAVETDGWAAHGHRRAFERDRDRDAHLAALGFVVLRVTWRQLRDEPILVAARLAQVLARRRPPTAYSRAGERRPGGSAG